MLTLTITGHNTDEITRIFRGGLAKKLENHQINGTGWNLTGNPELGPTAQRYAIPSYLMEFAYAILQDTLTEWPSPGTLPPFFEDHHLVFPSETAKEGYLKYLGQSLGHYLNDWPNKKEYENVRILFRILDSFTPIRTIPLDHDGSATILENAIKILEEEVVAVNNYNRDYFWVMMRYPLIRDCQIVIIDNHALQMFLQDLTYYAWRMSLASNPYDEQRKGLELIYALDIMKTHLVELSNVV